MAVMDDDADIILLDSTGNSVYVASGAFPRFTLLRLESRPVDPGALFPVYGGDKGRQTFKRLRDWGVYNRVQNRGHDNDEYLLGGR